MRIVRLRRPISEECEIENLRETGVKYAELKESLNRMDDQDAGRNPYLFDDWMPGIPYAAGQRVNYGDVLYKVLQAHTSQEDWMPDITPSLYAKMLIPDPTVIYDWVQPDSTNPYMMGDKVRYNGSVWESIVDNNVWMPGVYGWKEE